MFHEGGASPLTIGDDLKLRSKSVFADGGTIGFDIDMYPVAGLTIGTNASIRAGGTLRLGAGASGPLLVSAGAKLKGVGIGALLTGTSIEIGSGSVINARYEVDSAKLMPVRLKAEGPLEVGDGVRIAGGEIRLDAGVGALTVGENVSIDSGDRVQEIELFGASITIGAGS